MINLYEDALLTMNLAELKYNRSDSEKNENHIKSEIEPFLL